MSFLHKIIVYLLVLSLVTDKMQKAENTEGRGKGEKTNK